MAQVNVCSASLYVPTIELCVGDMTVIKNKSGKTMYVYDYICTCIYMYVHLTLNTCLRINTCARTIPDLHKTVIVISISIYL